MDRIFRALLNVEGENRELEAEDGQGGQGGEEENEFTEQEFEEALARMKNGKAPGEDGVGIELVREAGTQVKKYILKVLNKCWRRGRVPEEWGRTIIVPIDKRKGDSGVCENYRGISLINHIVKIYERMIERRLREDRGAVGRGTTWI